MAVHLCHYLQALAASDSDSTQRPLTICGERECRASEVRDRVAALAAGLRAQGLKTGSRVALAGLATDHFFEAMLAVMAAGGNVAPLNWRWSPAEAAAAIRQCSACMLLADAQCTQLTSLVGDSRCPSLTSAILIGDLADSLAELQTLGGARTQDAGPPSSHFGAVGGQVASLFGGNPAGGRARGAAEDGARRRDAGRGPAGGSAEALRAASTAEGLIRQHWGAELEPSSPDDNAALICFTSGTTGVPKAALLSHAALHAQALAKASVVGYCSGDVYLHAAPLFHIGGISSAFALLAVGGTQVFMPRFDARGALSIIMRHRISAFIAVPAMVSDLVQAAGSIDGMPREGLSSVRRLLVGAGGMAPPLQAACRRIFPVATISTAYGMTEACSSMTFGLLDELQAEDLGGSGPGVCVGQAPPGIEIRIEQREDAEGGEVLTRGDHVMLRYWGDPAATEQAITSDGWLRTGDLGRLDASGRLWLLGRLKELIRSGGESVHAGDVERALEGHPGVARAAVVGLPHERLGEQVAALVVLKTRWAPCGIGPVGTASDGTSTQITVDELQSHCRVAGLAGYKLPRFIHMQAEPLPLNSSGKVVKGAVKEALLRLRAGTEPAGTANSKTPVQARSRL